MAAVEVKVPDIGDFKEVEVIEVLVKPGDTVKAEQSLVTVESDKASMEIPSSLAVASLRRDAGQPGEGKTSEGTPLLCSRERGLGRGGRTLDRSEAAAKALPTLRCSEHRQPASAPGGTIDIVVPDIGDFRRGGRHRSAGQAR